MDATVATGAAAMMAIRVLLDHDVPEENITLLSLLMAETGLQCHFDQTTIPVHVPISAFVELIMLKIGLYVLKCFKL